MIVFNFRDSLLFQFNNIVIKKFFKFIRFFLFFIFFFVLVLSTGKDCYSGEHCDTQQDKPEVLATILFIKETDVCTKGGEPSSYDNDLYKDEKKCDTLHYHQLEDLKYKAEMTVSDKKPIDKINLDALFDLVELYCIECSLDRPCINKDLEHRRSILLAFEFQMKATKGAEVTLKREIPTILKEKYFSEPPLNKPYYAKGVLDEGGHWINHQRADLFNPIHDVTWILTVKSADSEYCWELTTTE